MIRPNFVHTRLHHSPGLNPVLTELYRKHFKPNSAIMSTSAMNYITNLMGSGLIGGKSGDHAILKGHTGPIAGCKFSADHAYLATCGDQTLRIFNASTGKLERCWRHQRDVASVDISSDLSFIAVGSIGGSVFVYDSRTQPRSLWASWVAADEYLAPWVFYFFIRSV